MGKTWRTGPTRKPCSWAASRRFADLGNIRSWKSRRPKSTSRAATVSTLIIAGSIESFRASDQRFWHACPQCRELFVHDIKHLRVDEENPRRTAYIYQACGYPIGDGERPAMIRAWEWRPTAFGAERHPGFHIDAFISPMVTYEAIGRGLVKSPRGMRTAKDFANLKLGLPYRFRGSAPDHVRLLERREDLRRGHILPRGLLLVGAADVQRRGIFSK
ncbi:MAG TPA: terminase gpA endonuclease subunit [Roseiarcus sp.]